MKRLFLLLAIAASLFTQAQTPVSLLSYEQYKTYALGDYLNTPISNIRVAGVAWQNGDTASALAHIKEAIVVGMFDSAMVTGSGNLKGFTALPEWKQLKKAIEQNITSISQPQNLKIFSEDVYRFLKIYPNLFDKNGDEVLWKDYITSGSTGLKTFFNVRMSSRSDNVLATIRKRKKYYGGLTPVAAQLPSFEKQIKEAALKLEFMYPDAIFPPIYFLVGNFNAAGTPDGGAGQLIGLEFFSNYPGHDTTELGKWEKANLSDTSRLVGVVVHEMMHVQQKNGGNTVLAKCITEGACDFLTFLLLGKNISPRQYAYGQAHEKELYQRLTIEMNGTDLSYWMNNGEIEEKGIPSDMGYYIGFKICQAYYDKQPDKKKAIKYILEQNDFKKFLEESGYGSQFN